MQNVILAIHILATITLTGVILLQRSEGGALGMGGGDSGGLMSGRGAAGALVRTTMILATVFFLTTLTLTTMANRGHQSTSVIGDESGAPFTGNIRDDADIELFNETESDIPELPDDTGFQEALPEEGTQTTPEETPVENTPQ